MSQNTDMGNEAEDKPIYNAKKYFLFAIGGWVLSLVIFIVFCLIKKEEGFQINELGDSFGIFNALVGTFTLVGLFVNYLELKNQITQQEKLHNEQLKESKRQFTEQFDLQKSQIKQQKLQLNDDEMKFKIQNELNEKRHYEILEQEKINQLNQTIVMLSVDILKTMNKLTSGSVPIMERVQDMNDYERKFKKDNNRNDKMNYEAIFLGIYKSILPIYAIIYVLMNLQTQSQIDSNKYMKQNMNFLPSDIHQFFILFMFWNYWHLLVNEEENKIIINYECVEQYHIMIFLLKEHNSEIFNILNKYQGENRIQMNILYEHILLIEKEMKKKIPN